VSKEPYPVRRRQRHPIGRRGAGPHSWIAGFQALGVLIRH